jgi:hypothetical protein
VPHERKIGPGARLAGPGPGRGGSGPADRLAGARGQRALTALLTAGAVVVALSWLVVLVTVPWNLHFAARRAAAETAVSRERGISVRAACDAEAARISRRMLGLALSAHLATAVAAAVIAYAAGSRVGFYVAGIFLLSTAFRPAGAYVTHVRERITVLSREGTHPRDDVAALRRRRRSSGRPLASCERACSTAATIFAPGSPCWPAASRTCGNC